MQLKNKTALVTGASTGIGKALAYEMALNGMNVITCARRLDLLNQNAEEAKNLPGKIKPIQADITNPNDVKNLISSGLDTFATIDVVFNNATSFVSIAGIHELNIEKWWQDVTVNIFGSMLIIKEILPSMLKRNEGIIINMNGGRPIGGSGYACGKAGLMELSKVLVKELEFQKSNVLVVTAGPGLVRTEATERQAFTEQGQKWIPSTKSDFEQGNLKQPEDIAKATINMLKIVTLQHRGKHYGPDTDFSNW